VGSVLVVERRSSVWLEGLARQKDNEISAFRAWLARMPGAGGADASLVPTIGAGGQPKRLREVGRGLIGDASV
jgi:hypothetical protein